MPVAKDVEFAEVQVAPTPAVQLRGECKPDPASISAAMHIAFAKVMDFVVRHGLTMTGQPRAIYTSYGAAGMSFTVALPVAGRPEVLETPIEVGVLPGMRAYRFTHHGPYAQLAATYGAITEAMKERGLMQSEADWGRYMPMWEEYMNDPERTPASELVTYIYLPA